MSVRRLAPRESQPESFAFSDENLIWAREQIKKYPPGKQASAIIPLLFRAQQQHQNWLPKAAIEYVANLLEMPFIRALEVATFYTQFQLQPVGTQGHVQVCGTTPCMLRGANELKEVCKKKIHQEQFHLSPDGTLSWEEVECLGACVNAPMIQIFNDTYEDLSPKLLEQLLDNLVSGKVVRPGPQVDRQYSAPFTGAVQSDDLSSAYPSPDNNSKKGRPNHGRS